MSVRKRETERRERNKRATMKPVYVYNGVTFATKEEAVRYLKALKLDNQDQHKLEQAFVEGTPREHFDKELFKL